MEKQAAGAEAQGLKPRSYTDEYRRQVVGMATSAGRTATSVAAELAGTRSVCGRGIHHALISRWVRRHGQPGGAAAAPVPAAGRPGVASLLMPAPVLHADQAAEVARLRRENERLRTERDILKNHRGPAFRLRA